MGASLKERLAHILWIGGATDSGKSTVAQILATRHNLDVFHYDKEDARQIERLVQTVPEVRRFAEASLEERWIKNTPEAMFEFLLVSFRSRFGLVVEDLLQRPADRLILVEGFGLLPELLQPVLTSPFQAVWLVPTHQFKWASMTRRGKPSFAAQVSDPQKAKMNIFTRDALLADFNRAQVPTYGCTLFEVDGTRAPEEMADLVDGHFHHYISWGS